MTRAKYPQVQVFLARVRLFLIINNFVYKFLTDFPHLPTCLPIIHAILPPDFANVCKISSFKFQSQVSISQISSVIDKQTDRQP